MNIEFIALSVMYLFFSGCTSYYGRYGKTHAFERPLLLNSLIIQLLFVLVMIAFIVSTIIFFFFDWKIVILSWVIMIIFRSKIEDISIIPFGLLYEWIRKL
ncbi:MAG: hypothetical protein COX79_01790 [Candidatus Levybacteria bacterium CG_4_10_14_0_2_um_filter_36_16]|nr:MAG: hypothetical protein COX79_01790 [Candidatus Levybacteria bacterium CG_4_10_14_0_2_um_filter_36_16]